MSLINTKDVIRMKIPYPSIGSGLAVKSHMYICKTADSPHHEFIRDCEKKSVNKILL